MAMMQKGMQVMNNYVIYCGDGTKYFKTLEQCEDFVKEKEDSYKKQGFTTELWVPKEELTFKNGETTYATIKVLMAINGKFAEDYIEVAKILH